VNEDDLRLAAAVLAGEPAAVARFEREVLAGIDPAVARVDPALADEVRQELRVRLLVERRLEQYAGRGPLLAWVRVAAMRTALNLRRARRPGDDEQRLAELVAVEPDPELRHLRSTYRAAYAEALAAAFAALPDRSRVVLRLHWVDGLRLAQIAGLYGVHESSVSRWLAAAADSVAAGTRARLVEQLRLGADTLASVERLVRSQLDLSLRQLLGGEK
jgi:RNA polymerase sigma-70 factor (ECF subfamily)